MVQSIVISYLYSCFKVVHECAIGLSSLFLMIKTMLVRKRNYFLQLSAHVLGNKNCSTEFFNYDVYNKNLTFDADN